MPLSRLIIIEDFSFKSTICFCLILYWMSEQGGRQLHGIIDPLDISSSSGQSLYAFMWHFDWFTSHIGVPSIRGKENFTQPHCLKVKFVRHSKLQWDFVYVAKNWSFRSPSKKQRRFLTENFLKFFWLLYAVAVSITIASVSNWMKSASWKNVGISLGRWKIILKLDLRRGHKSWRSDSFIDMKNWKLLPRMHLKKVSS